MNIANPPAKRFRQACAHENGWSDHYGAFHVAAAYSGYELREPYTINGIWQHGVIPPWGHATAGMLVCNAPGGQGRTIWVARQDQADLLHANGYAKAKAIGLPILYTQSSGLPRTLRSLLIMPVHTLVGMKMPDRALHERYADEMLEIAADFDHVAVCLSPNCQKNGFWVKEFGDRGFTIVSGAATTDANALARMRMLFEQFETVTTNGWGSHIPYALTFGARVSIYGTLPAVTKENLLKDKSWQTDPAALEKFLSEDTKKKEREFLTDFYAAPRDAIARADLGNWFLGAAHKLTPEEMREALPTIITPCAGARPARNKHLGAKSGKRVLFVTHEASRTGAPMFLLHFLRWLRANTDLRFDVMIRKGGPLATEFQKVANAHFTPEDFARDPSLVGDYDLIYSNSASSGLLLESWEYHAVPIITHVHELECAYEYYGARHMAAIIRQSNAYVACAETVADRMHQRLCIPRERIIVQHEMVDASGALENARRASRSDLRQQYDIPEDAFVVAACGTFDLRKGPDIFAAFAGQLKRKLGTQRPVRFLWIGAMTTPGLLRFIEEDIRKLGLKSDFKIIGELPSPHGLLSLSDIFCLTSREDPFPLVMLEAGALGKPTVCFEDAGGAWEFCQLGGGLAVPYLDISAMAEAALALLHDPERRRTIGERAAELVRERFSIEAGAPRLWEHLKQFLNNPLPLSPYRSTTKPEDIYTTWSLDDAPQRAYVAAHLARQRARREAQALAKAGRKSQAIQTLLRASAADMATKNAHVVVESLVEISDDLSALEPKQAASLAAEAKNIAARTGLNVADFRWHKCILPSEAPDAKATDPMPESSVSLATAETRLDAPVEFASAPAEVSRDLPVVLVRSHEYNYSETFVEDHVNHLTKSLTLLYGYPFPRFVKGGRSVLPEATEQKLRALTKGGKLTAELWAEYSAGLAAFLTSCGARVALVETGLMGAFVHEACEQAKLPYVVHFHGLDAFGRELLATWKPRYEKFFKSAHSIVAVSKAMRTQLLALGAPVSRTLLGPYGVSVDLPARANPAQAEPRFVAVGRFVEKKAPQLTLQAFAAVQKQVPAARLVMIGDGPLLAPCQEWAKSHGLAEAVTFAGVQSREKVSRQMAASRVFVQHSITASNGDSEGLPLAVLEAGAHGLPVVSTRHAGIPDAVREGVDGILVNEKDVAGMAAAMLQLAQDPALAARLGASFRARVEERYSRQRSLDRLLGILTAAAEKRSAEHLGEPIDDVVVAKSSCANSPAQPPASGPEAPPALSGPRAAIAHDRNHHAAYLELGRALLEQGALGEAYCAMGEAHRLTGGTSETRDFIQSLEEQGALGEPVVETYRRRAGWLPRKKSAQTKRVLVVTNLLPPQEMGGYGRTMWEFGRELVARGHTVRVLTADMPHLVRKPSPEHEAFEPNVRRQLRLFGDWKDGVVVVEPNPERAREIARANHQVILAAVKEFRPDVVIAGNIDFVGHFFLQEVLNFGIPVLHRLGNARPGYEAKDTPRSPLYCIASCSEWVNENLRKQGYGVERFAVLPPGSPLTEYFRAFPPQREKLRIAFASLLMPYKGAHVLVEALAYLHHVGIDFECTLAGDTTSPDYLEKLRAFATKQGFLARLQFPGFLSKKELAALYARSNVLVFPSVFEEPFGKTQIEAMAAGLVVISSGNGGARDIIRDGETGLFFKNNDGRDLAEKLTRVHRDPRLAERIAAAGQADAFRFTTGACVERLENILQDLVTLSRRKPAASKPQLAATHA